MWPRKTTQPLSALPLSWLVHVVVLSCLLPQISVDARFPLTPQCTSSERVKIESKSLSFCLERGGGLKTMFPSSLCHVSNEAITIESYELISPKSETVSYSGTRCSPQFVDGFSYEGKVNSSCLQANKFSRKVKNAILPLIRMYSGRSLQQMKQVDSNEYYQLLGPDGQDLSAFTWIKIMPRCIEKKSTVKLLYADICSNMEQEGASTVHIEFLPDGGSYVNQSSCSCNIFSGSGDPAVMTLRLRAIDVRLYGSTALLLAKGQESSRVLNGSEILYWYADGDLVVSRKQLYLELDKLSLNALPERVWVEVAGTNLTVNCGPANEPGGHQPYFADSSSLGVGYIILIIVSLIILIVIVIFIILFVLKRRRLGGKSKDDDEDYDISMGSQEDIRDRFKQVSLRQQMSTESGPEPAVEIKTQAEVMYPRKMSAPVPVEDESHKSLLDNGDVEPDKMPQTPPPPPPHDPSLHEFFLCRQLSYIDDEEENLPPPPPLAYHPPEEIYNHLNEHQRPDVVPGNIYDTKPQEENHYSTTQPKKHSEANGPVDTDTYVM
ncbi:hypothetical protein PoB_001221600 [Plakobranchus ocellatus]|uniref:CUB domain-containing protein n=1 Tax=Plakobranchus ocellatus TaxID=259542 RepID=A0AAV3YQX0_9GAST|nr:hypothetical protein PoB_001221600 [Plakobranchus ocellatus]